jgi:hypothetical protein
MRRATVLLLLAACSDDHEKTASEIAVEENSALLCDRLFDCCTPQELDALPFIDEQRPPTHEGCVAYHTKTGREYLPKTEGEAGQGHLAVHPEASAECIKQLREESCSEFSHRLLRLHVADAFALCNETVVEPLRDDGEPCGLYLSCKDGYCDNGTCKALPKAGEACTPDPGCSKDMRCDPNALRCAAYGEAGDDCTDDGACFSGMCSEGKCITPGRCGG